MSFFSDDEDDPSYPLDPNARPPRPGAGVNRTRQPSVLSTASMSLTHDPDTSSSIQGSSRNPLGGGGGGGDRGARDRSRSSISHLSATASPGRSYVGMSVDDDSDMASLAGPGLGPSGAGRPRRGEGDGGGVDSEIGTELDFDLDEDEELDDVRRMGRVWVRERGTVEIQQWEGDLIDSLLDKLEQQVSARDRWFGALDIMCGPFRNSESDLDSDLDLGPPPRNLIPETLAKIARAFALFAFAFA